MKIQIGQKHSTGRTSAFTLIEMIGVLAVIAILAALLVPKIFEAINSARVNNTIVSYNTIKTATMDHYGKYGSLNQLFGTNTAFTSTNAYDTGVLLAESLIDKPFAVKVGTGASINSTNSNGNGGAGYSLAGNGTIDTASASTIVEAVITGVAPQDAFDISSRLDGATLTAASPTNTVDNKGRVEYTVSGGTATVYMYITHR